MNKFWIVMKEGLGSRVTCMHPTIQDAETEASRLCRKENAVFVVLEAVEFVSPAEVPVTWENVIEISTIEPSEEKGEDKEDFPF